MTDSKSTSALIKRSEQLKRWEESDTNKQSPVPKTASRIKFSRGIVFLAACAASDKDEVQRLLTIGADINTANVDGLTALHQACIDDNLDMVEFLVSNGADVNKGDNEGWTPLHATSSCGFISIAKYLLENNADVAAVNYDGELPVDIAESEEMIKLLTQAIAERGVDCNKSRNAEVNLLINDAKEWAVNGYVDLRDVKTGGTPLHVAAAKGYNDVAKMLLENCNADPNSEDYEGWTPLHAAALWGQKTAAGLLLKYGADPHLKNYAGQTCMDLADPSLSQWLEEAISRLPRRVNNNNNNNNNKRKRSPPRHDVKRVDIEITGQPEQVSNDISPAAEIVPKPTEGKPPAGKAPSPEAAAPNDTSNPEAGPSWRRPASFRSRQQEATKENTPPKSPVDNETILRRTHSFENDKTNKPIKRLSKETIAWSTPATPTNPNANTNNTQQPPVWRSFVSPVRDEESETRRKAHAKRVRETRRSTQGVTLDEIKSAEQLVKKKSNGTTENTSPDSNKKADDATPTVNSENGSFELEDATPSVNRPPASATEASVTLMLRRPPTGSSNTTTLPAHTKEENCTGPDEKEKESPVEIKSLNSVNPPSTGAALNVVQRRRRPKRRSTGVGHVDMEDIVNDCGGGDDGDAETDNTQSGSERTEEVEERDYKLLYEASMKEVRRLQSLLSTSEQQLREAHATITRLSQVNHNSLSEIEKREKRAIERKLSEMEEELKQLQKLKAENERLRAENRALTRVVSKLTNSATK